MSFAVFISYSTRDLASAEALTTWVAKAGAIPFIAEYSVAAGTPLATSIMAAIKSSDLFLLLWSNNAKGSDWVPQEIGVARGAGKPIMPVVLQADLALPGFISDLKYLAVYADPANAVEWLYQHLVARVKEKDVRDAMSAMGVIGAVLLLLSGGKG